MTDYEAQRRANLLQKQLLLDQLNLGSSDPSQTKRRKVTVDSSVRSPAKRQNTALAAITPTRISARIAAAGPRASYTDNDLNGKTKNTARPRIPRSRTNRRQRSSTPQVISSQPTPTTTPTLSRTVSLSDLLDQWNKWTPTAPQPVLTPSGTYHFASHPSFTPNKSPLTILLEGAFGGSYFSPWRSRTLNLTLSDDYLHTLPKSWLHALQPPTKYLTAQAYDPSLNKYQVQCGQTLSEWEASGWLNFEFDPRGWFEWYIRFFLGRRCEDDDRQVGRWRRCVGDKGRWKRILLKKYVDKGVRTVYADDDDEDEDDGQDRQVSPVIHQICHHWAFEVRQVDLDQAWIESGRA
ncbi:uncharacterized protein A1O9_04366 [Exophiala aquamarina CBS 119918]|uniref:Uncharacterized protein n=1 Tax=Exophiala aquamarina CBS 119918 TaxID=1182545 RepID=A0A072PID9_9EURO|nr:uncharacterized protein A1O9_04366 [Exophiala aquamarina CBS 119918]KEF59522.1 hypothetical protein A1O9_04366 [Exophiala aquamarina CBS 119918]